MRLLQRHQHDNKTVSGQYMPTTDQLEDWRCSAQDDRDNIFEDPDMRAARLKVWGLKQAVRVEVLCDEVERLRAQRRPWWKAR